MRAGAVEHRRLPRHRRSSRSAATRATPVVAATPAQHAVGCGECSCGSRSRPSRELKDATVFIILKIDGKPVSSGSGFVIAVQKFNPDPKKNSVVIIATNRHVAVADPMHLPP